MKKILVTTVLRSPAGTEAGAQSARLAQTAPAPAAPRKPRLSKTLPSTTHMWAPSRQTDPCGSDQRPLSRSYAVSQ